MRFFAKKSKAEFAAAGGVYLLYPGDDYLNYNEAIEYIHSIPRFVRPLGNERLERLLTAVGEPQKKLKFVHVAGTNGKGSVCSMLAEVLKRAGYKTGLFTSPFIEVFNERIRINNELITDDELAEYVTETAGIMERENAQVSEFAFITAVALKFFADKECDIVVLETGMGGRLDATNIIPSPEVAVLTSIGMDHMQYLGETAEEIAEEKCGIIKPGTVVTSAPNVRVMDTITAAAEKVGAELIVCEKNSEIWGQLIYKTWIYELSLKGQYQFENASLVIETVNALIGRGWKISKTALFRGLQNTKWKARYEFAAPNIIIDGAHNIDGIRALKESLATENKPVTLVIAMMKDKSYDVCIHTIAGAAKAVVATELNMERSLTSSEIKRICDDAEVECYEESNIERAIEKAQRIAGGGLVCICGSLYLAGEAEKALKNMGIFSF